MIGKQLNLPLKEVIRTERGGLFLCYKISGEIERMYHYYSELSAWRIFEYLAIVKTQEFLGKVIEDE